MYPIKPTIGDISVINQQKQKTLYDYHLVKNMNSALDKIVLTAIDNQWIKGEKDMVMLNSKKSFVELVDWIYVRYVQITPGYLMDN